MSSATATATAMPEGQAALPGGSLGRFGLTVTPMIKQLLQAAASSPDTPHELKGQAQKFVMQDTVPWRVVQEACVIARHASLLDQRNNPYGSADQRQEHEQDVQQQVGAGGPLPSAAAVCAGCSLVLPAPRPRQRSEQLQQRLCKLQEQLDSQHYAAMVADVTRDERDAAAAVADPFFPTTKMQLSFGLHVLVTMGTFFALGYYAGIFLLHSQTWAAMCGCVGLVCGLLLETTIFILRMSMPAPLDAKYGHLMDKTWDQPSQHRKCSQQQQTASHHIQQSVSVTHSIRRRRKA